VSTSFLVLSAFASTFVLEKMLVKSIMGYAIAAVSAYGIWFIISKLLDESNPVKDEHKKYWVVAQWVTTGFLWYTWLSHDMANIAVFLPRQVPIEMMFAISVIFVSGLYWMFRENGGRIQTVVLEKHNMILWVFKEWNDIPMSTTWVFIGLLTGRELAIASFTQKRKFRSVFPLVGKDFFKMMIGLAASVGIVIMIHTLLQPQ
jgi:hypothetical protein